jgi:hypothetical protein
MGSTTKVFRTAYEEKLGFPPKLWDVVVFQDQFVIATWVPTRALHGLQHMHTLQKWVMHAKL